MPHHVSAGNDGGAEDPVPLCVDLDGTLIRTDMLWECIVQLWAKPVVTVRALFALLLHGKSAFKTILAEAITIDPATLPYREDVLALIRSQCSSGRKVVLATATHRIAAQRVADHLGVFCRVFATEYGINLSGASKSAVLESAYGRRGFDYIGDSRKDLPVFSVARKALLVNPSRFLVEKVSAISDVSMVFSDDQADAKVIARALRLHQWAKNVLLAVPLLAAHMALDLQAWIGVGIAFVGFGAVASATYVINDLVDLQSDRQHPEKRFRPLASGRMTIPDGILLAITLGLGGFVISSAFLPKAFTAYLVIYVSLTLIYSFYLKSRLLVDVLALAILYTLRILAGGTAIGVVVSEWLLMFSLFMFLSLAFLKRGVELRNREGKARVAGRGYFPVDMETIRIIGVASGLMSALVLVLYVSSAAVSKLYRSPQLLWLLIPLLIYWIARIWFLVARGEVHHDPVMFALRDIRSYVVGVCGFAIVVVATVGPVGMHW